MCLYVKKYISGKESIVKKVYKELDRTNGKWETPFQSVPVPNNGILAPDLGRYLEKVSQPKNHLTIHGGFIHFFTRSTITYVDKSQLFEAYAINLYAYGTEDDAVSAILYIPILDTTTAKAKRVRVLKDIVSRKINGNEWKQISKIFPKYVDYFKNNRYYKIEMQQTNRKVKKMKVSQKKDGTALLTVDWVAMRNYASTTDLLDFANGDMNVREFESLGTYPRKIVRALGASALRTRIRKSKTRLIYG